MKNHVLFYFLSINKKLFSPINFPDKNMGSYIFEHPRVTRMYGTVAFGIQIVDLLGEREASI